MAYFDGDKRVYRVSLDFFCKKCYAYSKVISFYVRWGGMLARLHRGKLDKKYTKGLPSKRAMMGKVNERFLRKRCVGVKGQKAVPF